MKKTFDFDLIYSQLLNSMNTQKHGNREKLAINKGLSLIDCKLVLQKKLIKT